MRIPDEILKCVAFIGIQNDTNFEPKATGFFVSVPLNTQAKHLYLYFVTAKHAIEQIYNDSHAQYCLRVNDVNEKSFTIPIRKNIKWYDHPNDQNVDAAVIPFNGNNLNIDIKSIPISFFLEEQHLKSTKISIGSEVFITGLFNHHFGIDKNLPIVRCGNIAMIPSEKIYVRWHNGVYIDAYLIEARSIGGISGSPVFFVKSPLDAVNGNIDFNYEFYFGGIIHGHWAVDECRIDSNIDWSDRKNVNMGIAIVTPAMKVLEILNCKELQEQRLNIEQNINLKE